MIMYLLTEQGFATGEDSSRQLGVGGSLLTMSIAAGSRLTKVTRFSIKAPEEPDDETPPEACQHREPIGP